jgi:hypothetical protein
MPAHLVGDLRRELRSGVVHRQHDAIDLEAGVQVIANEVHGRRQLREPFEGVELALDRDQHRVCGGERVTVNSPSDGGPSIRIQSYVPATPSSALANRRSRRSSETSSTSAPDNSMADGANEESVDHVRDDDVPHRQAVHERAVHRPIDRRLVDPESARCVSLGIEVDDEDPSSGEG